MNNRIRTYLPLSLLLSTMVYAMDQREIQTVADTLEAKTAEKVAIKEEHITENLTLEKVVKPSAHVDDKAIVITPEQSVIIPPVVQHAAKKDEPVAPVALTSSTQAQSKRLGFFTGFKDRWYGEAVQVSHEIATDKFDKTVPANMRRLSKAFENLTQDQSQNNLALMKSMLENCRTKEIVITDLTVLSLIRDYTSAIRKVEEKQLTDESKVILQNADKERVALLAEYNKVCVDIIEKAKTIDKKVTEGLDGAHKKHDETILVSTEAKRLTRKVTPKEDFIKTDGYDSDTESKYDRPFNARKLGLEEPTKINHKLNNRVADNFEILKNLSEHAEKQSLKVGISQVASE